MKIGGFQGVGVTRHEPRRDRYRPTKGNGKVSKIATDAGTFGRCIVSRGVGISAASKILDVIVNPVADRRDSGEARLQFTELMLRESHELIRFAVSARVKVWDNFGRQCAGRRLRHAVCGLNVVRQLDSSRIMYSQGSRARGEAMEPLFLNGRTRFLDLQLRLGGEMPPLIHAETSCSPHSLKNERARPSDVVVEVAADSKVISYHIAFVVVWVSYTIGLLKTDFLNAFA